MYKGEIIENESEFDWNYFLSVSSSFIENLLQLNLKIRYGKGLTIVFSGLSKDVKNRPKCINFTNKRGHNWTLVVPGKI